MTGDLPGDIGGAHPLGGWLNKLKRALVRRTLQPGLGYKLRQTEQGTTLEILPGGGGNGETITAVRCRLLSIRANSLKCRRLDTSADIYVAKPFKLRNYITRATVGALVINYTYDTTLGSETRYQSRTATSSGYASETQRVVPRYLTTASIGPDIATDEIWALELADALWTELSDPDTPGSEVVDVDWLDINADGRAWARQY